MVRLSSILFMLALLLASASPTLARVLLISDYVRCELSPDFAPRSTWAGEGDGPTDYVVPRGGNVQFFDDDTFTFTMPPLRNGALPANTAFSCRMTCMGNLPFPDGPNGPGDPVFVPNCGTTNHHGDAKFKVQDFRSGPGHSLNPGGAGLLCTGPLFEIYEANKPDGFGAKCKNGFGQGGGAL